MVRKLIYYISSFVILVSLLAIGFWYIKKNEAVPEKKIFIQDIVENDTGKQNLIIVVSPKPNQIISSPLVISGEARGYWFFEASFPVKLLDGDNKIIAEGIAQAQDEWMTENFVPFKAELRFVAPLTKKGILILEKDNPSGLSEHNNSLTISVQFTDAPQTLINALPSERKIITRVIDGDTVIMEGGESVRLLGIDSDERGYSCYEEAKRRMEELTLNKIAVLEKDGENKDKYQRYLRYLIVDGVNISTQMVEDGLAVARFSYENTKYKKEIAQAEKEAMQNHIGCKWKNI